MFTVNHQTNRISPVQKKSFGELRFTERGHLQEWLAYQPDALGEELLIIQKEFAGFDDTRERLDLLALDKDGKLVIIENKLDDSGRDVVWQALKYASYCASLTKAKIVDIYQQYLGEVDSLNASGSAEERICEFLGTSELDETRMNPGNSQRVMLVAANFRKEVTSVALWLLDQGINIQCFEVTLYKLDEQPLINIDQIIPTPGTKELMIGIKAKEAEEKKTEVLRKNRNAVHHDYWEQAVADFQESTCDLYDNISPHNKHWLSARSSLSGCRYDLILVKRELRVDLYINRSAREENKFVFDFLEARKDQIEDKFGESLEWQRLDDKNASRIAFSCEEDGHDRDRWRAFTQWHVGHMSKLEQALRSPIQEAAKALEKKNFGYSTS